MTLAPPSPVEGTAWSPAKVRWLILAVSVAAGLVATIGGPEPTGAPLVDLVLVAAAVGGITWFGAAALRWDAALVALIAGITSFSIVGAAVGVLAAVVGYVLPVIPGRRGIVNAALIGIAMNIAARSHLGWFLGASTLIAIGLAAYLGVVAFRRRTPQSRRGVAVAGVIVAAVAFGGAVGLGIFGYLAADELRAGNAETRAGLAALGDGDVAAAQSSFDTAADSFDAADARLSNPLAAAARFVPGLAQHHRVATELSSEAADAARFLSAELDGVDLDDLTVTNGRIDIAQVRSLQAPLLAIQQRIESLQTRVAAIDSPWLIAPVDDRIDALAIDLAEQRQRSDDALTVALAAPGMLGGDGPRTYYIGFTTPAEARGSGGFMGNWAEMTITDGQIEMTRFGRADDLNLAGDPTVRRFTRGADAGLDEWIAGYGPFNLSSGPDGTTGREPWKNINMSPDIATTGRAIADLYPQSGGGQLDGVFIMDVYTLARFLEFTGPIPLPDGAPAGAASGTGPSTLTADTAAKFLLNDQYDLTKVDARADVLETFSRSVIDTLLAGTLPAPTRLLDTLGPMVDQGRFTGWMSRADDQAVLEQIGMSGTLPTPGAGDGVAVVFNNAVGNKIDYFLGASASYSVTADARTGTTSARLEVTMTNGAPVDGEPGYVIGNPIGLPVGTNRTRISVFTRLPVKQVLVDGQPAESEPGAEADYFVTSVFVLMPAGATAELSFELDGPMDVADGYELVTRTPPTVAPTPFDIDATWIDADGVEYRVTETRREAGSARLELGSTRLELGANTSGG
jgi:hypothetical protein